MPVWQMPREVVGAKHRQHAVGAMAQRGRAVSHFGMLLAGAGMVRLYRDGDFVDHRRHFSRRFPAWLAGFQGDRAGQLGFVRFQQRRKLFDNPLAHGERLFRPRRKRAARGVAGLFNLPGAGIIPLPEHLVADRIGLHALFAFARYPVTVDP